MSMTSKDRDQIDREKLREWFVDRKSLIDSFQERLAPKHPTPILVFFGLGGSGKTYLFHYLREQIIPQWEKNNSTRCPSAYISFRPGYTGISIADALWSLRAQLRRADKNFTFPRFDLLFSKFWERTYKSSIKENRNLLPDDLEWVKELLEVVEHVPAIGDAAKILSLIISYGGRVKNWFAKKSVLDWFVTKIEKPFGMNWKVALQLIETNDFHRLLVDAFATDLVAANDQITNEIVKPILLVDTYEYLQDQLGIIQGKEAQGFIQTLAEILVNLNANVLLVIAGRNKIRWGEVQLQDGTWSPDKYSMWARGVSVNNANNCISPLLEQYSVDNLSEEDSLNYLEHKRGMKNEKLNHKIYHLTRGYPLALSTTVDLLSLAGQEAETELRILSSRSTDLEPFSEAWERELNSWLLERLLEQLTEQNRRDMVGMLRAAAIPRWFNEDLLYSLIGEYNLQEKFDQLLKFSFVEPYDFSRKENEHNSFRLHPTMRKLLLNSTRLKGQRQKWNEIARDYFENRVAKCTDPSEGISFQVEAIYHRIALQLREGFDAAESMFFREIDNQNFSACESIIHMLSEIDDLPLSECAKLLTIKGRYYKALTQYELAVQSLMEAELIQSRDVELEPHRIMTIHTVADTLRLMGKYSESLIRWRQLQNEATKSGEERLLFLSLWGQSLTLKLTDDVAQSIDLGQKAENLLLKIKQMEENGLYAPMPLRVTPTITMFANLKRHQAELLRYVCNFVDSYNSCQEALSIYKAENVLGFNYTRLILAHLFRMEGAFDDALELALLSKDQFEKLRDLRGVLSSKRALAQIAYASGNYSLSEVTARELISLPFHLYPHGVIYGHLVLGEIARFGDEISPATNHYDTAIEFCQSVGGKVEIAYGQLGLTELKRIEGNTTEALKLASSALSIGTSCKLPWIMLYANLLLAILSDEHQRETQLEQASNSSVMMKIRPNVPHFCEDEISRTKSFFLEEKNIPPYRLDFL